VADSQAYKTIFSGATEILKLNGVTGIIYTDCNEFKIPPS